jgi:hypothetical protein
MRPAAIAMVWLTAFAWAAEPVLSGPPDRVVDPGTYVTLVFRVDAPVDGRAAVAVTIPEGWGIVRTPDGVELRPDRSTPIALTLGVPATAPAGAIESVTLSVVTGGGAVEQSVRLTVSAAYGLTLDAPREVAIGGDPLVVGVTNTGNVSDVVDLTLLRVGQAVANQRIEIAAGATAAVAFDIPVEGSYVVTAVSSGGPIERRNVGVVRFGGPAPAAYALVGEVAARATLGPTLDLAVAVAGPLSETLRVDARIEPSALERTHLEMRGEAFTVRLGPGWRDPLQLGIPNDTLFAGTLRVSAWTVGGVVAGALDAPTLAAVVGGRRWTGGDVAVALGRRLDDPWASVRGTVAGDGWEVGGGWRSEHARSAWRVEGEVDTAWGTTTLGANADGLGGDQARVALGVQHRVGATSIFARGEQPLVGDAPWDGRVGAMTTLSEPLPGDLHLSAEIGVLERRLRVEYRDSLPGDWRTLTGIGATFDAGGFGLSGEARWVRAASGRYASYEARLGYASATSDWDARLSAQQQRTSGPWSWTVGGTWDLGEGRVVGRADAAHASGPWSIGVGGRVAYAYDQLGDAPWSVDLALRGTYAWTWSVPEEVTAWAGGRSVGVVEGAVAASDGGLAGVRIDVGPYRLITDADGNFEVALPPGEYVFRLDTASVPAVHRLVDPTVRAVTMGDGERVALVWRTIRTTVLDGIVSEPSGTDTAGATPRGVEARLEVVDAEGLRRFVSTGSDGRFQLRGLVPGPVTVRLVTVPVGATVIGEAERSLRLVEGEAAAVAFVVEPVRARARSFTERPLRIRAATVERDRVPPGSAPLVRVTVVGEADVVEVRLADASVALVREDDAWTGRVPLPTSLGDGPLSFTVAALVGETEVTRRVQVEIASDAPALEVVTNAPVSPGETLTVEVHAVVDLVALELRVEPEGSVALEEVSEGRWVAEFRVPDDAATGIREAVVVGVDAADASFTVVQPFRVRGE